MDRVSRSVHNLHLRKMSMDSIVPFQRGDLQVPFVFAGRTCLMYLCHLLRVPIIYCILLRLKTTHLGSW